MERKKNRKRNKKITETANQMNGIGGGEPTTSNRTSSQSHFSIREINVRLLYEGHMVAV
jgi:hypothetical protein